MLAHPRSRGNRQGPTYGAHHRTMVLLLSMDVCRVLHPASVVPVYRTFSRISLTVFFHFARFSFVPGVLFSL